MSVCGLLVIACKQSSRWLPWQHRSTHPTRHSHSAKHPLSQVWVARACEQTLRSVYSMKTVHTCANSKGFLFWYNKMIINLRCCAIFCVPLWEHQRQTEVGFCNLILKLQRRYYKYCFYLITHFHFSCFASPFVAYITPPPPGKTGYLCLSL